MYCFTQKTFFNFYFTKKIKSYSTSNITTKNEHQKRVHSCCFFYNVVPSNTLLLLNVVGSFMVGSIHNSFHSMIIGMLLKMTILVLLVDSERSRWSETDFKRYISKILVGEAALMVISLSC